MMLLIDAGNTRVKWALAEAGAAPGACVSGSSKPSSASRAASRSSSEKPPVLMAAPWLLQRRGRPP
ncbi:MAG: hypothetical protein RR804_15060, partial [Massilia sp.]